MKKTLVAIAALAAFGAQAQSSVTIDGVMDAGWASINYKGNKTNGVLNNGSSTSQINFRGVEDLGGGLKAQFRVETDWNTVSNNGNTGAKKADGTVAAASTFGNGEIRGGLVGGFGQIDFGAINNAQLDAFLTGQPYGTAIGGGFRGIFSSDAASAMGSSVVRFDNSVRYITPAFSGISASVLQVNKNTAANTTNFSTTFGNYDYAGVNEYSLRYNAGPINAIYGVTKQDLTGTYATTVADATLKTLGANYTYGAFKFFLLNQTASNTLVSGAAATLDRKASSYSVAYTMGQHVFTASTGSATNNVAGATNTGKSSLSAVGYDYNLSKTTAVYARYESIKDLGGIITANTQQDAVTGEKTRTRTAVGLRIGF